MVKNNKNIFNLLIKNALRIIKNSKILITQLGILLLIGISVIGTIFMSTFLLSKSKNTVLKEGNVADFTITIPQKYIEESIKNNPNNNASIFSGETAADLELQEYLLSKQLNFTFSKNLSMNDLVTNNSFILSLANYKSIINENVVNALVTNKGGTLPTPITNKSDLYPFDNSYYFYLIRELTIFPNEINVNLANKLFNYDTYILRQPWKLAKLLLESNWNLSSDTTNKITEILKLITTPPKNKLDYINNYYPFIGLPQPYKVQYNTNSYFYKLAQKFHLNKIGYNGYGYSILGTQTIPLIGITGDIPFSINYYDKASFFTVLSSNFLDHNTDKNILHSKTIQDVMKLPYKVNIQNDNSLNPALDYKVYNQDTGKYEIQKDFLSWFSNLDSKYKVTINSLQYIIAGSGNQPNILYPVQSASQLLVDSKTNGVAYVNNVGFARAVDATSYKQIVYYSVRYPPSLNLFEQNKLLKEIKEFTLEKYGEITAFTLSDKNQPNRLFYVWANFLNNVQYIVTSIGGIIGGIVIVLALFFIGLLIRSILKLNKTTFAIGLANGVSKTKLIFSFFPFALIPSLIFGTIAFFVSYFLIQPTLSTLKSYWTLHINTLPLYWWIWLGIIIFTTLLLFTVISIIILVTFRKNVATIFNDSDSFKLNPIVIYTKKITNKFSPIWSFRTTFMMNNIGRFVILLFSVVYIISLSGIIVGTNNIFQNAISSNIRNKNYLVSYDLYSPTINSGYYSDIRYNMLGVSEKGMFNAYDVAKPNYNSPLESKSEFYTGLEYNNALTYPYVSNAWFTSLFMTNSSIANEVNWNFKFLNNRIFSKLLLDVEVNALGAVLNPWEFAREIIPEPIQHLATTNDQYLAQINFDFYLWLQNQNKIAINNETDKFINIPGLENTEYAQFNNKPITYKDYLPNINGQPFTLDNSDLSEDYLTSNNQNEWIFIKEYDSSLDSYIWALNKQYAINGAPSFTIKPQTAQLFVQLLTNNNNPLFRFWYEYCYDKNPNKGKENQIVPDYNYKIGSSVVPIDFTEETYTYLDSILNSDKSKNIHSKIIGIKPNSNFVKLYDEYGIDMKNKLKSYQISTRPLLKENGEAIIVNTYPLIINNVVEKKYRLKIGDVLLAETSNTFDRFNKININENPIANNYFQIIGITPTNYEEQYYTLQEYANNILGYQDFSKVSNENWLNHITPSKNYIPFNGVFSQDKSMKMIQNFAGFYSPSGLSTILGDINDETDTTNLGALMSLFQNNSQQLDSLMNLNLFVDRNNNNKIISKVLSDEQKISYSNVDANADILAKNAATKISKLFQSNSAIVSQLQNINASYLSSYIGSSFDNVWNKIQIVILNVMLPTLFMIILLLAVIIIFEAKRLISLLKILGYGDIKNLFSFLFVYIAVLILGTIISFPISYSLMQVMKAVIFTSFNIITLPVLYVWPFLAGFGGVGLMFSILFLFIYMKMKKLNLGQEISGR